MPSVPAELVSLIPPSLHSSLHSIVENHWFDWIASCEAKKIDQVSNLPLSQLGKTWACSDFVARNCIRYPAMFFDLLSEGMDSPRNIERYKTQLVLIVSASQDESQLMTAVREFRQQEMVRIAWRDLNSLAEVDVVLQELTDLAEAFVSVVLQYLERQLAEKFGMPLDAEDNEQSLLVFAMGKMGGGELNFSSDIDLIFTFAEDGETTGRRKTSHYEFYLAVIRKLVKVLDEITVDGFVYRVDTRLRPFGKSGSLAMSFAGLEQYYQLQGRDWERYAMIKARLITGREADKKYLQSMLTPFVYRRYLDFSMIDSIREMKSMINAQMKRKGMTNNIKLGHGGIREIEFIGQTLQLIRAGREPDLRERSIIKVLVLLAEKNYLTAKEADCLTAAYWFLRKLENRLQMLGDKQTHVLPEDDVAQQQVTLAMGFVDWPELVENLAVHQQAVDAVFQNLITSQRDDQNDDQGYNKATEISVFALFWSDAEKHIENDDEAYRNLQHYLQSLGYQQAEKLIEVLNDLHASSAMKNLSGDSARLMAQLMESLVEKIADYPEQLILFERVIKILKALAGRKVYISLLNEYPAIQLQMLTLSSASEWFTERLTRYPILLDSLLSTAEAFRRQYDIRYLLELELQRIASDDQVDGEEDLEQLMERMRQFKRQTVFTIAMLDVFYDEPVEKVSDQLTNLANMLLEKILEYSWQAMVLKYGEPQYVVEGETITASMGIVAYGKMGGNELGYGSDLDIIFVHDSQGSSQATTGQQASADSTIGHRSIDNQQFFALVAQRVIHFLNVRTYSGILYEADTRLRPDGQSGLMVSSMTAFERYQREKAWTWEHQALIRARFITSNVSSNLKAGLQGALHNESQRRPQLEQDFDRIRCSVIQQPREQEILSQEVVKMREKMREHLTGRMIAKESGEWDFKQDRGGLVDIEFMTQAGVLLHAEKYTDCVKHTATLELINELQKVGFYNQQDAVQLSQAYRLFRKLKNWQNLQCDISAIATKDVIKAHRDNVATIWHRLMPEQESS